MGRRFFLVLLARTAWFTLNVIGVSIGPDGVGTQISGKGVVREAGQLEARFRTVGALDEAYMLFGGDVQRDRNSLVHVTAAGLPIHVARAIAAIYPDFHRCNSPGAPLALESVTVPEHGADITRDVAGALRQTELVLAQSVQIQDCQTLLR